MLGRREVNPLFPGLFTWEWGKKSFLGKPLDSRDPGRKTFTKVYVVNRVSKILVTLRDFRVGTNSWIRVFTKVLGEVKESVLQMP